VKRIIRWATQNSPAMNTVMLGIIGAGLFCLSAMRREVFPEFEMDMILVTVPYPGAGPEEIEEGICEKLEEAVRSIAGIKKQTSVAKEGSGFLILEVSSSVTDVGRLVEEVRSEINRIPRMPELAEDPEIKQVTFRTPAIRLGIVGPQRKPGENGDTLDTQLNLRTLAEEIRSELLQLEPKTPEDFSLLEKVAFNLRAVGKRTAISQANVVGSKPYQIDVEIPEHTLRRHGLSLRQIAATIRQENVELPAGTMKGDTQEFLLRAKNKRLTGQGIEELAVVKRSNRVSLSLGEIAEVIDGLDETPAITRVDGRPAVIVSVDRTANEDLFIITSTVKQYADRKAAELPDGYELKVWGDVSEDVQDRISLLSRNGLQGLLLVFIVLAIFLELRLAFWVALGIPVAILGSCILLISADQTLNMLSMFAFLLALGIVVDDAIVIGENIYTHRKFSNSPAEAAVNGTQEVLPSVLASVSTTMVAFAPLLFVTGLMGKFIAVMPVAVLSMLAISLFESMFILPCHLAHEDGPVSRQLGRLFFFLKPISWLLAGINRGTSRGLNWVINNTYMPTLGWAVRFPVISIMIGLSLFIFSIGLVRSGIVTSNLFPNLDGKLITAKVRFPDGTPEHVTDDATRQIEDAMWRVVAHQKEEHPELIRLSHRSVGSLSGQGPLDRASGSHVGSVEFHLVGPEARSITSNELKEMWRKESPAFPLADDGVTFASSSMAPTGTAIEFKLMANKRHWEELEAFAAECQDWFRSKAGVKDVRDDSHDGKIEYQFTIKESARPLGITSLDLANTLRSTFFGEEVMRLQRGRHEVKLMVRYPKGDRRSPADLKRIRVVGNDKIARPLSEVAEIKMRRGYSEINRVDQLRSITVLADVDKTQANAGAVIAEFKKTKLKELEKHPSLSIRWEGEQEQQKESMTSLMIGFCVAIIGMFLLLTIEFRSYFQPLMILGIIPFGLVGAIWGHVVMEIDMTLFSVFGMVALTGVVVNDSIVLIDFINARVEEGMPLRKAILEAGRRRFRPVLLTSLTTIAGLLPLLTERSFQAQILVPMATSLSFGLMLATFMVLFLIPCYYVICARLTGPAPSPRAEHGEGPVERGQAPTTATNAVSVTPLPPAIAQLE